MQLDVVNGHGISLSFVTKVGGRDGSPIYNINRVFANYLEAPVIRDDSGVLINADPEHPRITGYSTRQPADPSALREVLVDDHMAQKPEAGCHAI